MLQEFIKKKTACYEWHSNGTCYFFKSSIHNQARRYLINQRTTHPNIIYGFQIIFKEI